MTLKHGLSHGLACSFTLPLVWRLAQGKNAERDAVLQQVFGSSVSDPASALEQFLNQVGVSTQFKDYGVSDDEAHALVHTSMQGPRGRNFIGSHTNA